MRARVVRAARLTRLLLSFALLAPAPHQHTCFNTLLLPDYSCEEVMRERLCVALRNAEGFGLR